MEVIKEPGATDEKVQVYMKLAALFHDVGKPDTFFIGDDGIGHTYGHPARGAEIIREIMRRLKADRFTAERVTDLVKYHDLVFQENDRLLKRWLGRYGETLLLEILHIKIADNIATGNMSHELEEKFYRVEEQIHRIVESKECFSVKDLAINGRDVMAVIDGNEQMTSNQKGPLIGKLLDEVLEEVIDGSLRNDREALLARLEIMMKDQL